MKTYRTILYVLIGVLSFSSCVSKKKYLEMESFRLQAENQVMALTKENTTQEQRLNSMIADFEQMKQELLFNNARKDQLISQLQSDVNQLKTNVQERDESIDQKTFSFGFERQQFERELATAKVNQTALQNKISVVEAELEKVNNQLIDSRFINSKQQSDSEQQAIQLSRLTGEIQQLNQQMQEKDATIVRLNNDIAQLKNSAPAPAVQ